MGMGSFVSKVLALRCRVCSGQRSPPRGCQMDCATTSHWDCCKLKKRQGFLALESIKFAFENAFE